MTATIAILSALGCAAPDPASPSLPGSSTSPGVPATTAPSDATVLTCGGDDRFQPGALRGPGMAEFEPGPVGDALRAELAVSAGSVPSSGWHRVWTTPDRVLFVAPGVAAEGEPWSQVGVMLRPDGWNLDVIGGCRLAPVMPDGIGAADFWIDPAVGLPGPDATEIVGRIRELRCASAEPPGDRVLEPIVTADDRQVVITVPIRTRPGPQDCPGNPDVPIVIVLTEPLGDRQVLDGSVFPPRDASIVPD